MSELMVSNLPCYTLKATSESNSFVPSTNLNAEVVMHTVYGTEHILNLEAIKI